MEKPVNETSGRWSPYQIGITVLLFLAMTFAYMDRVNISVVTPVWIKQYHLDPLVAGTLLSVFNWVFTASCLITGPAIDKYHYKRILPISVFLWSAATTLTGLSLALPMLVFSRGLLGFGEAALIPSAARLISDVFVKKDRGKAVGIYFSGNKFGLTIGAPIATVVLAALGWHWVFYATGIISVVWLLLWIVVYRPSKTLKQQEDQTDNVRVTWGSLLTYKSTWALIIGQSGYLYIFYVFVTWLPSYFMIQRHMTILNSGFVSMLPFLVSIFTTIAGGWMADRLISRGADSISTRKTFIATGLILATIFVIIAACVSSTWTAVLFLILSMASLGITTANANSLPIDIAPRRVVSSLTSLQNFGGNVGGSLAPIFTGYLLKTTHDFKIALFVAGFMAVVFGVLPYVFLLNKKNQIQDPTISSTVLSAAGSVTE